MLYENNLKFIKILQKENPVTYSDVTRYFNSTDIRLRRPAKVNRYIFQKPEGAYLIIPDTEKFKIEKIINEK